jgi:peptidyl-prolyl cis-trans isomerase SurA
MCGNAKKTRFLNSILCFWSIAILFWVGNAPAEIVDRIVAVVNDDIILASDLDQVLKPAEASLKNRGYASIDRQRIIDSQRGQVLERLIYDKLTDQQVRRHNLKVKDTEVDATIQRIRSANKLTEEELRRALDLDGMTFDAYRKEIRDKMLRTRLVNREVKSKIVVTDKDIKSYYNAHKDQYAGSTKYDLSHILLRVSPEANQAERERVKDQINLLRERLQAGEPFDKLAGLFSEAPTASRGGRLGVFGTNLLTEEINQALKGLNAKQYSQVVETDQGYQIFYVENIISAGGKTLEQATPEIQEKLYAEVVDRKFKTWIEDLRKRSHIQILE